MSPARRGPRNAAVVFNGIEKFRIETFLPMIDTLDAQFSWFMSIIIINKRFTRFGQFFLLMLNINFRTKFCSFQEFIKYLNQRTTEQFDYKNQMNA